MNDDEPVLPPRGQERAGPSEPEPPPPTGPRARLKNVARRLLEEETTVSAKELIGAFVSTSDKAKTEVVRAIGREVRAYLEGLGTTDLLETLVNDYELEVNASFRLKPLKPSPDPTESEEPNDG